MEKKLTKRELLTSLIQSAEDPFCTPEKHTDIRKILETSTSFDGMNHLYLAECYFTEERPLFLVSRKEALEQAEAALREKNGIAYYYLYRLYFTEDPRKARNCLRVVADYGYPKGLLEMGNLLHQGVLFRKDVSEAYRCYQKAAERGERDGYYGMVLIDEERGETEKARQDYAFALEAGFLLPGTVE